MIGNTSKRYTEEFKLMILEMHKKGKTIRELAREYNISPHTVTYWKKSNIIVSYSRKGNPYDNACIESFHATSIFIIRNLIQ